MMKTSALVLMLGVVLAGCGSHDHSRAQSIPVDVQSSLRDAVEQGGRPGVVVGFYNAHGESFFGYGSTQLGSGEPVDETTTFAIGSLTKLFTAELLARQVAAGGLALDTTIGEMWKGAGTAGEVELWQLASHRAGLPRSIPTQALQANDPAPLLALLSENEPPTANAIYSNTGMALLGASLAQHAGVSLAELLGQTVLEPMGLAATGYAADAATLAHPHRGDEDISRSRPATPSIAHGAGGLYSSSRDLLRFARLHLEPSTDAGAAATALVFGHGEGPHPPLGWQVHADGERVVFHHGGDGNGYQGFLGVRPDTGTAVVLLTNSSADDNLKDVALHLLDPRVPLPEFDRPSAPVLDPDLLARYTGRYRIADDPDGNTIELQVIDDRLVYTERGPDGGLVRRSRLYAQDEQRFVLRELSATIVFRDGTRAGAALEAGDTRYRLEPLP